LSRCSLSGEDAACAEKAVHDFAEQGMRVLAVASAELKGAALTHEAVEKGLTFIGLVAMIDPPRLEVIEAVRAARDAGITVKMITGDHRKTAAAIGGQIGLGGEGAVDGSELATMNDNAFASAAVKTNIFARVAPEHKLRLVRTLQHGGQVVAMTGDGVNDAPALKQADIGVAMGITGTSVSKEASDMVLLDDNFATIKAAIEEGRRIYDNLIKSLSFLLPTNLCFAFLFAWAVAFFPFHPATNELIVPLSPVLLFWINLISSLMLGTPLAFEPADTDIMRRPPRRLDAPVLGRALAVRTVLIGAVMAASCIVVFLRQYDQFLLSGMGHELATAKAQTMALNTIVMLQLWYLFESRSLRRTLFELNPFSNPAVWIGAGLLMSLQIMITHVPVMNTVFGTVPLSLNEWLTTLIFGAAVIPITVIEKVVVFRIMKR
ncbi:MAG TPA: HAD-IC family P-type ATPase, partial [Spirochaetota bacterium]|nr:HAD-IC family P-type ATPase [Spirochaetota bacterium]